MEENIVVCTNRRCNIDILCEELGPDTYVYGARIRPWSREGKGRMVLGSSTATFAEALAEAVAKAGAGRWETLDWGKRPWATRSAADAW